MNMARLLGSASPYSEDWFHAPPIASLGLRMSDDAVRVAVAHRLGCKSCEPHTCLCKRQWMFGAYMVCPVTGAAPGTSVVMT